MRLVPVLWCEIPVKNTRPKYVGRQNITNRHNTQETDDILASGGIRIRSPSKQAAANPRFKLRGRWDCILCLYVAENCF